jgi:hypothetical protein
MRNALLVALIPVFAVAALSVGCGDASSTGIQRSRGGAAIPNDPSEEEGALPDPDQPANPNSNAPPAAPSTPGTSAGQIGVTLSTATPATDLGTTTEITVTVEPKAGFTGQAMLTATGLPAGVTATFSPASVTLNTTPVTAKLTLDVPFTTIPSAPGAASAIVIKAASGAAEATANANFKVNPKVTMTIPVNSAALLAAGGGAKLVDGWGGPAFGSSPVTLQTQAGNGITFIVKNADSTPRQVHGQGGFPHGDIAVPAGEADPKSRVLDPANANINSSGYIHGATNGTSVGFKVTVNKAP